MKNHEIMTLKLKRINVLDCIMAVQNVIHDFEDEIRDENTTDTRKQIAQSSIDRRWQPVLDTLKAQFAEQDGEEW